MPKRPPDDPNALGHDAVFGLPGNDGAHLPPPQVTRGDPRRSCPIVPLGHGAGRYHLIDSAGQYRIMQARQMLQRAELAGLFGGNLGWVFAFFPQIAKGDAITEAGEFLIAWCTDAGLWDDRIEVRGPGIWPGPDGTPALHLGDKVRLGGDERAAGFLYDGALYVAHAAVRRPADRPAAASVGRKIVEDLGLWSWRDEGAALLFAGWLGTALLGAAARWRPNIFLTGGGGTGKTSLFRLGRGALPVHGYTNETTRAGLVAELDGRPRPAFIDEDQESAAAGRLVALMRTAAGEEGTHGLRGQPEGGGRSFRVLGSVCMAAVSVPDMPPQDASRFSVLELAHGDGDSSDTMKEAAEHAREAGPALWARMLDRFGRWQADNRTFRAALVAHGCRPREADHLGALLAGWWVLTEDAEATPAIAAAQVRAIIAFVRTADEVASDDGPQRCLQTLVTAIVFVGDNRRRALGELLADAFNFDPAMEKQKQVSRLDLARLGVGAKDDDGGMVWFGNRAQGIAYLFRDSPWAEGAWRGELLRLPGAAASGKSIRIGGRGTYSGHAVGLPVRLLLDGDV